MTIAGKNVLLVDDHAVVRTGLASVLVAIGAASVREAGSTEEALNDLANSTPDVVVSDLSMPGPNGLQLTRALRTRIPSVRVLMLSSFAESLFAEQAIAAGALGYLMKEAPVSEFRTAVETVAKGSMYLSETMWKQLAVRPCSLDLSKEDTALLTALAQDNPPVAVMAERMQAPQSQIMRHMTRLTAQLRLPNDVALRLHAARNYSSPSED